MAQTSKMKTRFKERFTDALNDRNNIFYQIFLLLTEKNATPFCYAHPAQ